MNKMARTEISLTLTNKFEVPDDDDSDMKALFVRYVLFYFISFLENMYISSTLSRKLFQIAQFLSLLAFSAHAKNKFNMVKTTPW